MREHNEKAKIREAIVAGIFYPDDPAELETRIATLLDAASPGMGGAFAIIAPHASLGYAGDLNALAWKAASERPIRTVVVLSPIHRGEDELVYLPESESYATPMGEVAVDQDAVQEILDCGTSFERNDIPHFEEHGIEVQLPFMRRLFPDAALVPILLGTCAQAPVRALASALDIVFGSRLASTLVVISTDLASGSDPGAASGMADRNIAEIGAGNWKAMIGADRGTEGSACGSGCIAAFVASGLSRGLSARLL
ncbi:MAG: AmmeMemoRadiSam system protein B, partial [Spirochaetaceae bacterium]|nr:AmmeMemoRadiSam system protein B [Spirochaetaceae bacterium]